MKVVLRFATWLLVSVLWTACARQPVPGESSKKGNAQAGDEGSLPFNQPKQEGGISPSSSLVPSAAEVPAGTSFIIRLKSSISNATANVGESFEAELDESIVVQGKPIFSAGTPVAGVVVALRRSARGHAPAYLRLKLTSIIWRGKTIAIESSSIVAEAGVPRSGRKKPNEGLSDPEISSTAPVVDVQRTVRFNAGRRLTFRLTAPAALPR